MKRTATLLALILALICPALALAQTGATAAPDHVHLNWTADSATGVSITWRTNTATKVGVVEYTKGPTLAGATRKAATSRILATDLGDARIHSATLTGLSPDTQYSYRVGNGDLKWSTTYTFTTAPAAADKVKFLVFGDSQSVATGDAPYGVWSKTLNNACKANPDARFAINVGDLVDVGQSCAHWNAWFNAGKGVIDTIPLMPVIGNHETGGSKETRRPAYYLAQFTLPPNGPEGLKGHAYSFDYGPVHIVVLDSQRAEQKQYGDILEPQKRWLEADLKASKAPWKFVFFHKPPYELHATRKNTDVKEAFCPIIEANHVDMVFSAHDHGLNRTYPMNNDVIKRKPSEGTVYCIVGRSGTKAYSGLTKKHWNSYFAQCTDQPNYQVMDIDGKKLTMRIVKQDGTPIDTFTIDKAADTNSDCLPK